MIDWPPRSPDINSVDYLWETFISKNVNTREALLDLTVNCAAFKRENYCVPQRAIPAMHNERSLHRGGGGIFDNSIAQFLLSEKLCRQT